MILNLYFKSKTLKKITVNLKSLYQEAVYCFDLMVSISLCYVKSFYPIYLVCFFFSFMFHSSMHWWANIEIKILMWSNFSWFEQKTVAFRDSQRSFQHSRHWSHTTQWCQNCCLALSPWVATIPVLPNRTPAEILPTLTPILIITH